MRTKTMSVVVVVGSILIAACGSPNPSAAPATAGAPVAGGGGPTLAAATELPAAPPEGTSPSAAGRDVSTLDVCALLKQEDIAAALKTQIARPADRTDMGKTTHGCTYYFGSPNSATNDSYIVYVDDASLADAQMQMLTPEEMSHPVSGYGDVGYLITEMDGTQFHLEFLRKGDAGVEVIGSKSDWVLAIGQMVNAALTH